MNPIIGPLDPVALTTWPVLQVGVPTVQQTVAFLPRLVGALVVLLIGWLLGRGAFRVVRELADRVELDKLVLKTPLGRVLGGTEASVSHAFGTLAKWFVYALAILAAADVLAIPLLSEWIATAVSYLPAFVAGLLVIVFGFIVADWIGDAIERTRAATETAYTAWFAGASGCSSTSPSSSSGSTRWASTSTSSSSSRGPSPGASRPRSPSVPASPSGGAATPTSRRTSAAGSRARPAACPRRPRRPRPTVGRRWGRTEKERTVLVRSSSSAPTGN